MKIHFLKNLNQVQVPDGSPEWFRVFPVGKVEIKGEPPAYFDEESADIIMREFRAQGHDMVVDYEHQTLSGGQAPAAGWIHDMEFREGKGLYVVVRWTDKALEYFKGSEYRYFSPVAAIRKKDRKVIGLYNVALTNQPRLNHLPALAAKFNPESETTEGNQMFEKLLAILGLSEDATEEDVIQAIQAMMKKLEEMAGEEPVAAKEIIEALGANDDEPVQKLVAKIEALKIGRDVGKGMGEELIALRNEVAEMKAGDLVKTALKDGRMSPDEADKWGRKLARTSPDDFDAIVMSRPKGSVVPVGSLQVPKDTHKPGEVDEAVALVAKQMGIDIEDVKKYGGLEG